jgi:hypothetical protein
MIAKLTTLDTCSANRKFEEKETVNRLAVAVVKKGDIITPIHTRFYMSRTSSPSVVYCNIWAHGIDPKTGEHVSISGRGSAGGGGYHKESAALNDALRSAGVELYGSAYDRPDKTERANRTKRAYIGGCGSQAMESARRALARACGYKGKARVL